MQQGVLRKSGLLTALAVGSAAVFWSAVTFAATPTVGGDCGSGATIVGSEAAGKVTVGQGVSTCTLTPSAPWANAPACTAMNETKGRPADANTTKTTVTLGAGVSLDPGDVVSYMCIGY